MQPRAPMRETAEPVAARRFSRRRSAGHRASELRRAASDAHAATHDVQRQCGAGDGDHEKDEVFAADHHVWIIGATCDDFKSRATEIAFNSAM
jgi:hypothetical protein